MIHSVTLYKKDEDSLLMAGSMIYLYVFDIGKLWVRSGIKSMIPYSITLKQVHIHNELDILAVLILMVWYRETHIPNKVAEKRLCSVRWLNSQCSEQGYIASCPFSGTFVPRAAETVPKRQFQ